MINKARANNNKLGYPNIEFILGEIENIPLDSNEIDVVISNCVLNLVPDKKRAYDEIFRVLKHGGHFCISDVVVEGDIPEVLRNAAELYAGCISGALQKGKYLEVIGKAGFTRIEVKSEKQIVLPDSLLSSILTPEEIKLYHQSVQGIFSITVTGSKI